MTDCCNCYALEIERDYAVTVDAEPDVVVLSAGEQGPPGPPGTPGGAGSSTLQRNAGTALSALRLVHELDGLVYPLDYRDADNIDQLLGLTTSAASQGGLVNVQRTGPLTDSGWNWTPGRLWLGADGALTQTPPADGFDVVVGFATSATSVVLDMQLPITLEY